MRRIARIAVFALIVLAPTGVASYFLAGQLDPDVGFVRSELAGDRYLRPLARLLEDVTRHRVLVRRTLRGFAALAPSIGQTEAAIERDFADLAAVDRDAGGLLRTGTEDLRRRGLETASPSALAEAWERVARPATGVAASDTLHDELLDGLRALYRYVGDTSNLILDPELDSYYVMDAFLLREPSALKSLAEVRRTIEDVAAAGGGFTLKDRVNLEESLALLGHDADALRYGFGVAFTEVANLSQDEELRPALTLPSHRTIDAITDVVTLARTEILEQAEPRLSGFQFTQFVDRSISESAGLWPALFDQQDRMLQSRVVKLQVERRRSFVVVGLVLAAAMVIGLALLETFGREMRRSAQGDVPAEDAAPEKDAAEKARGAG